MDRKRKKMYETFISNGWLTEKKLYINRTKKQTVRDKAELKVKRKEEKKTQCETYVLWLRRGVFNLLDDFPIFVLGFFFLLDAK